MPRLVKLYEDEENPDIYNVFVHGYAAQDAKDIPQAIKYAAPIGNTYLLKWRSGSPLSNFSYKALQNYYDKELMADGIGFNLEETLLKVIPRSHAVKVNLIGHSLGARIIYQGLSHNNWKRINLQDCILMGGIVDSEAYNWKECARKIKGQIINIRSD